MTRSARPSWLTADPRKLRVEVTRWSMWSAVTSTLIGWALLYDGEFFVTVGYRWALTLMPAWLWGVAYLALAVLHGTGARYRLPWLLRGGIGLQMFVQMTWAISLIVAWSSGHRPVGVIAGAIQWALGAAVPAHLLTRSFFTPTLLVPQLAPQPDPLPVTRPA